MSQEEIEKRSAELATAVVAAWIDGARHPELRRLMNVKSNSSIAIYFARLRAAGYPVPRRRPGQAKTPIWVDPLPEEPIIVQPGWSYKGSEVLARKAKEKKSDG